MIVYYTSDFIHGMIYQLAVLDLPTVYDTSWWIVPGTLNLED